MAASREAIVLAAGGTFAAHGYEGASFSRVAEAMGKPKSAVGYHLFPSKLALATAVVERQQERWAATEAELDDPAGIERLTAMLLATSIEARTDPVAAGAVRLLHELLHSELPVPRGFIWSTFIRAQLAAAATRAGIPEASLPEHAHHLLLEATFGLVTTGRRESDAELARRLRALWVPLLVSFGFTDAERLVPAA